MSPFLYMRENLCTCRLHQFPAVTTRLQKPSAHLSDFCLHTRLLNASSREIASSFAKRWVISTLKESKKTQQAFGDGAIRSRSDTIASNMAAPK